MCKDPIVIQMADDLTIDSDRNGSAVAFWMSEETQRLFLGARGLRLDWNLISVEGNVELKVIGRKSIDGRTWQYFGYGQAGSQSLDGLTSGIRSVGISSAIYAQSLDDFRERTQLGIQIRNHTTSTVVSARLVMTATVLFDHFTAMYSLSAAASINTTGSTVQDVTSASFDTTNFDGSTVFVGFTGTPTGAGLTFLLRVSPDGTNWATVATSTAQTAATSNLIALVVPYPSRYTKVSYTLDTGTGGTPSVSLIGRVT